MKTKRITAKVTGRPGAWVVVVARGDKVVRRARTASETAAYNFALDVEHQQTARPA